VLENQIERAACAARFCVRQSRAKGSKGENPSPQTAGGVRKVFFVPAVSGKGFSCKKVSVLPASAHYVY